MKYSKEYAAMLNEAINMDMRERLRLERIADAQIDQIEAALAGSATSVNKFYRMPLADVLNLRRFYSLFVSEITAVNITFTRTRKLLQSLDAAVADAVPPAIRDAVTGAK
jgi:hypothetical protein